MNLDLECDGGDEAVSSYLLSRTLMRLELADARVS